MFDLKKCELCPRRCGADRTQAVGRCGVGAEMKIARGALHFWEEPPISGTRGSGTVFFAGCSLGCVYCQNRQISRGGMGKTLTVSELAALFRSLEQQGAHNINLVTPTHYALPIAEAVALYGKRLPIVYNTSGYERPELIRYLADTVDVYLTDLKYAEAASASAFSHAADYPAVAREALAAMVETVGEPRFDQEGMLQKGVVVRLLVLPCATAGVMTLLGIDPTVTAVALLVSAMPCGMNTIVFPKLVGEDCRTGAALTCVTSILCCVTIPLCLWFFGIGL